MTLPEPQADTTGYLKEYAYLLGTIVGNLASLELVVRVTLHDLEAGTRPAVHNGFDLEQLKVGTALPLTALTSWDSLGQLIGRYNELCTGAELGERLNLEVKHIRDTLLHGRILSSCPPNELIVVRMSKPRDGKPPIVEAIERLSISRLKELAQLVREQLQKASSRLGRLQATSKDGSGPLG